MKYVIALDAGTTSVRAFVYDLKTGKFVHGASQEIKQSFPRAGWVEQDANEIYYKAAYCLNECVRFAGAENVAGMGITNQRETVVLWDKTTGEPVCPAIVWQCRRTSEYCAALSKENKELIRERTGLVVDAYFSASKIRWILDNVPKARTLEKNGTLCAGTIDSYLIFKFTEGRTFATDVTNASRTMLFNIKTLDWDEELLQLFGVSREILPEVRACDARMGEAEIAGSRIPIAGVIGDQQAALFGQGCLSEGDGKITYGTGLFLLFNTGGRCAQSKRGMLSTIGYSACGKTTYALEGSAFNAGSAVQWLRDGLGFIKTSAESERVAESVESSGGVYFVPAFTGLGAPYWNAEARGLLTGITRSTTRAHIVRAVLESIAFSARDLASCMEEDSGIKLREIKCDGGASANNFLMQFQSNVLGVCINRPVERESTALGAALMCALSLGLVEEQDIPRLRSSERIFTPSPDREKFDRLYGEYCRAVQKTLL
ncbi:MAG: glycerol kinase GlpK [Clostridia bacterium]|nr:glycerol kinase GlpK [Clostridia bacterium]